MRITLIPVLLVFFSTITFAQQWQKVNPDGYDYFRTCNFINKNEGWVLARNGYWANYDLIHTTDGANSFVPIFTFPQNLLSERIQMVDSLNGFARIDQFNGNGNYFWATYDGGHTWTDITDTALFNIGKPLDPCYGFYFLNKDVGIYGGVNSIYRTENGGITWNKMNAPTIIDTNYSNNYKVNSVYFVNEKYGWAACTMAWDAGFVLKTIDGGLNWTACPFITGDLYTIHFADSIHGGTTGGSWSFGIVLLTENNFDTLSHIYINEWAQIPDGIYYQNDSTIWMSGYPAVIYKSTDRGASFIEYDTSFVTEDQTGWIHDFQFFGNTGYAYAYSFLLKYVDTLNTAIPDANALKRDLHIFPNPASKNCRLTFWEQEPGNAIIDIYSINGILILQDKLSVNTGENNLNINIEQLHPGIYMISVKTSGRKITKRIVKLP